MRRVLAGNVLLRALALLGGILMVAACSERELTAEVPEASGPAVDTAEAFRNFLDDSYALDMARAPYTASYRGLKLNHGQWNSVSERHQDETRRILEQRLLQLGEFDRAALDPAGQLSWDIFRDDLQRKIASDEFRHHKFVIHQHRGPHTQAPANLINIHRVTDLADAEAYIQRLNNISVWFDEVIEQLRIRQDENLLLADWQYPRMIAAARKVISGVPYDDGPGDSSFWADFQVKVTALELPESQRDSLLTQARTALLDSVGPAYQRLIAELELQAAIAPEADGVWKFSDGDAFYAERLNWYTTTELSADDIHAIGLREVARIHDEMQNLMAKVKFEGSLAEFFQLMREDARFYYSDTPEGRNDYLKEASRLIRVMYDRLPDFFGLLPQAALEVKRVEAFREGTSGKAFYQGPPPDGTRPGIFYANLRDMADMPKYQMEALAYHEGAPGHHMQLAIAAELKGVPEFQKFARFTVYSEGWGLYAEQLAKEMGFYQDPYSDFGRLAMELWRACRLVVDTGIHSLRWSREDAIDYLMVNTPNAEGDVINSIERYIAQPGQATAYMIGKLRILELREKAREAMGDKFDIRDFHDLLLEDGMLPLWLLEKKVDRMITTAADAGS